MERLAGRVAIVTGGGRALGRATALLLAHEGARVMVTDEDDARGRETVALIAAAGGVADFFRHRVAEEDDWRRLVDTTLSSHYRLDILAHTVHDHVERAIEQMSLAEFRALELTNIRGPWLGLKYAGPAARIYGHGSLVVVSSSLGLDGRADAGAAAAAGAFVRMSVRSAALEFASRDPKVRVNAVLADPVYFGLRLETASSLVPRPAAGDRLPSADDVAQAVLYAASDAARFMTGSDLIIGGPGLPSLAGGRP